MKLLKKMWKLHLGTAIVISVIFMLLFMGAIYEGKTTFKCVGAWGMLLTAVGFITITTHLAAWSESKSYNNGICKDCGKKLKCFDMDSQGGRGYTCKKCDYTTWVSYPID